MNKNLLNQIDAVIFDMDGSLAASMHVWHEIDLDFLALNGQELPEDYQKAIEGISMYETAVYTINRFQLDKTPEELMTLWNDMAYQRYANEIQLKDGVPEFLEYCKQNHIKLGIASSNSATLVNALLDAHQIKPYFSYIAVSGSVEKGKPEPDIYLHVAQKLEVSPDRCLVFEDVIPGIMAAKTAGMHVIAVDDDYSKEQEQQKRNLAEDYIYHYYLED